ncbi:MAG: hypothetical protein ACI81L_002805 [Verrucomicrobiales bacterium]
MIRLNSGWAKTISDATTEPEMMYTHSGPQASAMTPPAMVPSSQAAIGQQIANADDETGDHQHRDRRSIGSGSEANKDQRRSTTPRATQTPQATNHRRGSTR